MGPAAPGRTPRPNPLTRAAFLACFAAPMRDVTATAEAVADIWEYVEAIDPPAGPLGDVAYVYRDAEDRFDQVLVATPRAGIFLVVVVDLVGRRVHGHHLLDLAAEYGG